MMGWFKGKENSRASEFRVKKRYERRTKRRKKHRSLSLAHASTAGSTSSPSPASWSKSYGTH